MIIEAIPREDKIKICSTSSTNRINRVVMYRPATFLQHCNEYILELQPKVQLLITLSYTVKNSTDVRNIKLLVITEKHCNEYRKYFQ